MKRIFVFAGILMLAGFLAGGALALADTARAAMIYKTLDNGLQVVVKENHSSPVVSIRVYVRAGSIYEGKYLGAGISHLVEHLVHGGATPTRSEEESRRILESIGNSSNAYTSKSSTCYYITTVSKYFDIANDLLADWMQNCTIPKEAFEREFGVVQREIEKGEEEPGRQLFLLADRTMFRVHPCRVPVIGYKSVFRNLKREDVLKYYKENYVPRNMIVVAVGDFDAKEAFDKIAAKYGGFKRRAGARPPLPVEPRQLGRRYAEKEMDVKVCYMQMGFRTVPLSHPDLYPLDVLSYILSHGDSSRLVEIVKDRKQLVHSITSWSFTPEYDAGTFVVQCQLDEDKLEAAQRAILEELFRTREELVTKDELKKAVTQKIADDVFGRQTIEDQAADIGGNLLSAYDPNFSETYLAGIRKVTREQIRDAARRYFSEDALCVSVVRPRRKKPEAGSVAERRREGAIRKHELANGMRVLVKTNRTSPIAVVQAFWLGGVQFETPKDNGIFRFMSSMMIKGTKTRTADEIAAAFDAMGGGISGSSGNNTFFCTSSILKDDLPKAMEIFADVVKNPTFPEEEIEKMRKLTLAAIKRRDDNWYSAAYAFFVKNFFVKSPYRLLPVGEVESVKSFTRDQLVALHKRYCVPNNMVLAVFGDVEAGDVVKLIEKHFSDFKPNEKLVLPQVPADPPPKTDRKVVKPLPGTQAVVYVGYPGMTVKDVKDRYAMTVLDAVISGINYPGGWLHEELRSKRLVYVVHAYNRCGLTPGFFAAYAACEPEKVQQVVDIMLKVFDRIKTGDVSDEELKRAKSICITAEKLSKQRNSDQAMEAALDELYGLGYDFSRNYIEGIEKVTKADVKRVANKYFTHYVLAICEPPKRGDAK